MAGSAEIVYCWAFTPAWFSLVESLSGSFPLLVRLVCPGVNTAIWLQKLTREAHSGCCPRVWRWWEFWSSWFVVQTWSTLNQTQRPEDWCNFWTNPPAVVSRGLAKVWIVSWLVHVSLFTSGSSPGIPPPHVNSDQLGVVSGVNVLMCCCFWVNFTRVTIWFGLGQAVRCEKEPQPPKNKNKCTSGSFLAFGPNTMKQSADVNAPLSASLSVFYEPFEHSKLDCGCREKTIKNTFTKCPKCFFLTHCVL